MKEIWKDIKGSDNYQVSNLGHVRHIKSVSVYKNNVAFIGRRNGVSVPRLVVEAFGNPPKGEYFVRHIGNRNDNSVDNLFCDTTTSGTVVVAKKFFLWQLLTKLSRFFRRK